MLTSLLSAKLAAAAAAAAVTLGGAAAAAYANKLPAPVQKFAHDTIGAPKAPGTQQTHSANPQDSSLPGHSAYGLCTAYTHMKAHGSAAQKAAAFRRLAAAAGGSASISAYCGTVAHPGTSPAGQPTAPPAQVPPSPQQPAAEPSHPQPSHPTGKPTSAR